ncbi:class I SAM-dependent methyltransferase [Glutamicibacter sp. PS]|uniref:class I SAM-dependent methyltransferase n=1 Tax=Glutamicibacter sp. PS TaxID=3075634 RepID=UPI00284E7B80|nr:class I SAM-dependent methyltransferase [Glutamicibacter sp. PS]MDR4533502.1 class I SAM-dependent methyltransferase [Glutamicibacter sp. PS]
MAYTHPQLATLYDEDNPDGPDHDFYRALAEEIQAEVIVDVGCGTGLLTVSLAAEGRTVLGLDPAAVMLEQARQRPGSERVQWIEGDSTSLPALRADYAVLSGNVAQHIPDPQWQRTLNDLHERLRSGGIIAFESRNPQARAWESWVGEGSTTRHTAALGPLRESTQLRGITAEVVSLRFETQLLTTGQLIVEDLNLVFRTRQRITEQLEHAGFVLKAVYSDWQRNAFTGTEPLMIFVATVGTRPS